MTALERLLFSRGEQDFDREITEAEGLGPAFNNTNCLGCHENATLGGATTVMRFAKVRPDGSVDLLPDLGGPVRQRHAIRGGDPECGEWMNVLPSLVNLTVNRVTPPLAGNGLIEAIPDASIAALAVPDASLKISGRVHMVQALENPTGPAKVGRFGWKAQLPSILSFSADASLNEMGLTNRILREETAPEGNLEKLRRCDLVADIEDHPDDLNIQFIDSITNYQRFLTPPPQAPRTGMRGETIFTQVGCAVCHHPEFTTATSASVPEALRGKRIRPYSDFLLHDMGGLGDGLPDGDAGRFEMKTPPLWGLRLRPALLHDGSQQQSNLEERMSEAILHHFGEGDISRQRFIALSSADKAALLAFLGSLGRLDFDANGDGAVTVADYALIAAHAMDAQISPDDAWGVADLNGDRQISATEMEALRALVKVPGDCNQNSVPDWKDLALGTSTDLDATGIPDECEGTCTDQSLRIVGQGGTIADFGSTEFLAAAVPSTARGTIVSARLMLDIQHAWMQDLRIALWRGTQEIVVFNRDCGGADDLRGVYRLTPSNWIGSTPVVLCAGSRIDRGGPDNDTRFQLMSGSYLCTPLNALVGKSLNTSWKLVVSDVTTRRDVGTIANWAVEIRYAPSTPAVDCDHDGVSDCLQDDADCDHNGVLDRCELSANPSLDRWPKPNGNGVLDTCDILASRVADINHNGIPDPLEDSDGDGFPDDVDGCPNNPSIVIPGVCGCSSTDTDTDHDGTPNCVDGCPNDPLKVAPGACGCGKPDVDSDGDGVLDCNDACPNDRNKTAPGPCGCGVPDTDTDSDGVPNCNDGCPNDPLKVAPGACGCGRPDTDSDADGVPDCTDGCPNDRNKTAPGPCGCGQFETDRDRDGTPDCIDGCPDDPRKTLPGACGCGKLDTDADGDGQPDCTQPPSDMDGDGVADAQDGCPRDPRKTAPGTCGCGTSDDDTDGDGSPDCRDGCPSDPLKTAPGACGCGESDADTNGDGSPDCLDRAGVMQSTLREMTATDGAQFGWHAAISGDTMVIGSPFLGAGGQRTGAARVLARQPDGSWAAQPLLTAPDGRAGDWFGGRVAVSGDVLVVGAPGVQRGVGACYVFRRTVAGQWNFEQKLVPSVVTTGEAFGNTIAIDGATIVVGAPNDKVDGVQQRGSVSVFRRSTTGGWAFAQRIISTDGKTGDSFGNSVAVRGEVLAIGAPGEDAAGLVDQGAMYLFVRRTNGSFELMRKMVSPKPRAGNHFGRDVATDGLTVVANSPDEFGGAVYAYEIDPGHTTVWTQWVVAPDRDAADGFGGGVAVDGDRLLVGVPNDDVQGVSDAGSVRVFHRRPEGTWQYAGMLRASEAKASDLFGWVVALDGPWAIGCAPRADGATAENTGAVFAFNLTPGDCDGDGVADADQDGDRIADCIDPDIDGDGVANDSDGCPRDAAKIAPGPCGCGHPDSINDSDSDGVVDCVDNCPFKANLGQGDCNADGIGDACDTSGDCNGNGVLDGCELASGALTDLNGNGTPDACEASTLKVPSPQFPSIQSAIDAAPANGIILVSPGTYIGSINTRGKPLKLHAFGGPKTTIIDGSAVDASLIICNTGEGPGTVISGFTIRRGTRGTQIRPDRTWRVGGGLYVSACSPTIRNCVFENCRGEYGGGAYLLYSNALIEDCSFASNTAVEYGGGVQAFGGSVIFRRCLFAENFCGIAGGGLHTVGGAIRVEDCEIVDNIALLHAGGISWDSNTTTPESENRPIEIVRSAINYNFANGPGGGVQVWNGPFNRSGQIIDCEVCGNVPNETHGPIAIDSESIVCVDCDRNGIPDFDDIRAIPSLDCNQDNVIDACEIADGRTADRNGNMRPDECEPDVLFVPNEYGSIAAAIGAASTGQTIWLEPGTYNETLNLLGKAITIHGGGPDVVIEGSQATSSLLVATTNETRASVIENITFRGGRTGSLLDGKYIVGGGAFVRDASPTIRECIFEDCRAQYGGGAYMLNSSALVQSCTFRSNSALEDGGGLQLFHGGAEVKDCVFEQNTCSRNGGGLHIVFGAGIRLERCVVSFNVAQRGFGGGISWDGGSGIPADFGLLQIRETTVQSNVAASTSFDNLRFGGGGIFVGERGFSAPAVLSNSTVCENLPENIKGEFEAREETTICNCNADLDRTRVVDFGDVNLMLLEFGPCAPGSCAADLDQSGSIDFGDINILLLEFGPCL